MRAYIGPRGEVEAVRITERTFARNHPNPEHISGVVYDPQQRCASIGSPRQTNRDAALRADLGDWIVRSVGGALTVVKNADFARDYRRSRIEFGRAFADRDENGDWRVEYFDADGGCYVTIFSGPRAEERAQAYTDALISDVLDPITAIALPEQARGDRDA